MLMVISPAKTLDYETPPATPRFTQPEHLDHAQELIAQLRDFHATAYTASTVVIALVAENVGHVRSVATMTGEDLDPVMGRAIAADGVGTMIASSVGGSPTTTYAENIGVMAATRVYSTAAYWVAAVVALLLSFSPKFGEAIATVPRGVLGGAGVVLYGMIGLLGAKIWVESRVDFGNPINLMTAAVALIIGIADFTWTVGDLTFAGIALGSAVALVGFHLMRGINSLTGAVPDPLVPRD